MYRAALRQAPRVAQTVPKPSPRLFSTAPARWQQLNSLSQLTDEEEALRDAVRKFATEILTPEKVREMDENEKMDPACVIRLIRLCIALELTPWA